MLVIPVPIVDPMRFLALNWFHDPMIVRRQGRWLAKITGVKTRQVQHWAAGTHRPQGRAKDRLLELHYILERLRDVYTAEGADIWIHGRNRDLGGEKPIDLLAAGQFERVLAAVERLSAGTM